MSENRSQRSETKWLFDGTNVLDTIKVLEPAPEAQTERIRKSFGLAVVPFDQARSNLTIHIYPSLDGHPLGNPYINITWLAFCSGAYLKRDGRLIPIPAVVLRHTYDRFAYTDRTLAFEDELGLPRSVELYTSRALFEASAVEFHTGWGERYIEGDRQVAAKIEEGVMTVDYKVTAATNFLGWNIPLEFRLIQRPRSHVQNGNHMIDVKGHVASIRQVFEMPDSLFDPRFQQTVVDYRYAPKSSPNSPLTYSYAGASLPPFNAPELEQKILKHAERLQR